MPARLKLNLFSPLPPLPTDIANHTLGFLPALAARAEVALWTDQAEWDRGVEALAPVRRFAPDAAPMRALNDADAQIYNIGNNALFHRAIFDMARRAPGIVVLHDTRLQHFFASYTEPEREDRRSRPDPGFYFAAMHRFHGAAAEAAARRFAAGAAPLDELVDRYPLTLAAAEGALALVLHNAAEARALAGRTRVPVFHQPLSFAFGPARAMVSGPSREQKGGRLRLVAFGFIGANRRIGSVLEALAGMPGRERFSLDVYGQLEQPGPVREAIDRLGLGGAVKLHGFVAEDVLDGALAEADLVLNLRFPTMGEASGSQLRIWAAAAPALVTRIGWYADLPDDAVFFVDPEHEIASIRAHLDALVRQRARYAAAGRRGRQVLEERHDPARYAEGLLDIVGQSPSLHARRAGIDLARTAATKLLEAADAPSAAFVAPTVAAEIQRLLS